MAGKNADEVAYRARALEAIKSSEDALAQGHLETAVSRSYYACFYAVHSKLASLDLEATSHKQVGILFRRHFIANGKMAKRYNVIWEGLQKYRMDADYTPVPKIDPEKAQSLVNQAIDFVETLIGTKA